MARNLFQVLNSFTSGQANEGSQWLTKYCSITIDYVINHNYINLVVKKIYQLLWDWLKNMQPEDTFLS